ncbi:uncharacterized protein AAG666_016805 isoform 2-T2 [Megaptera novaeangliae]
MLFKLGIETHNSRVPCFPNLQCFLEIETRAPLFLPEASNSPDGGHSISLGPGMRTTQRTVPNQLKGSSLPYGLSGGLTLATPYTPHNRSCSLLYTARRRLELEPNLCGQMRKSRHREAEGLTHSHTAEVTEPELGGWLLSLCS